VARVSLPDGRELDVPDSDVLLLDYYRGEGASVEVAVPAQAAAFPKVFDGEKYVEASPEAAADESQVVTSADVEQLPAGESAEVDAAELQTSEGYGEPLEGVEAPADGTVTEISNETAPAATPADVAE
jgi:hypothetical protein